MFLFFVGAPSLHCQVPGLILERVFFPLPFGVISATKSSTVTCSSPFSLITSYAKAKNKSYHLKSLSVRKIFIEEGLRSCF